MMSICFSSPWADLDLSFRGDDAGGGWTMYVVPHNDTRYFYHPSLNLVTTERMSDPETRRGFQYQNNDAADRHPASEIVVLHDGRVAVANHDMETFEGGHLEMNAGWYF
jgi:hypothetical protein